MKKIVLIVCILLLYGCGGITDSGIREAYKICENKGGVDAIVPIYIDISDSAKVYCKDGTNITYKRK